MALVRDMEEDIDSDGRVDCEFIQQIAFDTNSPRCPVAGQSLEFAAMYKFDNDLWLRDFAKVFKKMLNHGYDYDPDKVCPANLCVYGD